jgi:polysaccharide deacetylase family protein (PEP-CTERM system associated)
MFHCANHLMKTISSGSARDVASAPTTVPQSELILSFDVEEHWRIEQASGLAIDPALKDQSGSRVETTTYWILNLLERFGQTATFFIVGEIALKYPSLVRAIHRAGHEVASHSWEHRSLLSLTADEFREDTRKSKDTLEQVTGEAVLGYRAPTFSIVRKTAWALDILSELGFLYDSSIFPVYHDRYGVPDAPRTPFIAGGDREVILEFPPATLRLGGLNLPVGGGGYFRLFPLVVLLQGLRQLSRQGHPSGRMLYFHPWEFDPEQPRLLLSGIGRFRTYVGIGRSRDRLASLLGRHRFVRTVDVAHNLDALRRTLPQFRLAASAADRDS